MLVLSGGGGPLSGCSQGIGGEAAMVEEARLNVTEGDVGLTAGVPLELDSHGGSRVGAGDEVGSV